MNRKYSSNFLPIFHSFIFWFFDRKRIENVGDSYEQQIFQELFADISFFSECFPEMIFVKIFVKILTFIGTKCNIRSHSTLTISKEKNTSGHKV